LLLTGWSAPTKNRKYYESRGEVVWEVQTEEKVIALTFDDGPHPKYTPQILDLLKQYDAKATFFVVGNKVKLYTYNHAYFGKNTNIKNTWHYIFPKRYSFTMNDVVASSFIIIPAVFQSSFKE
jgi:hypothetical protein